VNQITDEVSNWQLHGEVQEYFHAYTEDPVTILSAMTKWIIENPDKMILDAKLRTEWNNEGDFYFYTGIVRWA
jgi:hypothetical protein